MNQARFDDLAKGFAINRFSRGQVLKSFVAGRKGATKRAVAIGLLPPPACRASKLLSLLRSGDRIRRLVADPSTVVARRVLISIAHQGRDAPLSCPALRKVRKR